MFIAVVRGLSVLDFLTTEGFNPIGRIQPDREDSTRSEGVESYRSGVTPHRQQVAFRMSGTRFFVPCVSFRPSPAEVHSVRRRHAAHSGHAQVIGPTCVRERTHTRRRSAMETFEHNNFACNSIAQPFNSLYKRCNSKVAIWSCDSTPGGIACEIKAAPASFHSSVGDLALCAPPTTIPPATTVTGPSQAFAHPPSYINEAVAGNGGYPPPGHGLVCAGTFRHSGPPRCLRPRSGGRQRLPRRRRSDPWARRRTTGRRRPTFRRRARPGHAA